MDSYVKIAFYFPAWYNKMTYDYYYVCREGSKKMKQNFLKIPINRIIALILLDIMSIVVASFAALYIRFDFSFEGIPQEYLIKFENIIVYNIILTLVFFALWKLYKSVWRYASATELLNIVFATTCASIAQAILCHILDQKMPRSYYVLYWFLLFGMTCAIRFSYRILRLINSKRTELRTKKDGSNVMLIGAGAAANAILKRNRDQQLSESQSQMHYR